MCDLSIYQGHTSSVTSIGFQRDVRFLYSGSEDGVFTAPCNCLTRYLYHDEIDYHFASLIPRELISIWFVLLYTNLNRYCQII